MIYLALDVCPDGRLVELLPEARLVTGGSGRGELQPGQEVLLAHAGGHEAVLQHAARPARHGHRGKVAVTRAHVT